MLRMKYGEIIENIMDVLKNFLCVFISVLILCVNFCSCTGNGDSDADNISDDNYVSLAYGFTDTKITDEKSAIAAISEIADQIGIEDVENELKTADINKVGENTYYRFQQYYNDIPVYGKSVVVAADESGTALALTSNTSSVENVIFTETSITQDSIESNIITYANKNIEGADKISFDFPNINDSQIYIFQFDDGTCHTVYLLETDFYSFIIDSQSGKVLDYKKTVFSNKSVPCYNADGTKSFDGYYSDSEQKYWAYNEERNIFVFSYKGTNSKDDSQCDKEFLTSDDAYFGNTTLEKKYKYNDCEEYFNNFIKIHDYYYKTFGERPYENFHIYLDDGYCDGKNALGGYDVDENQGRVGYMAMGYVTGVSDIDVMAHEYTHIVSMSIIDYGSGQESGAINEGISDLFGEIIEGKFNQSSPDWIMQGDNISVSRNAASPSSANYPENVNDENNSGEDFEHAYATIISHAGYLMWNGIDGNEVKKIDCDTLAELWYKSLFIMQSNTTFKQCANAITLTATQMLREGTMTPNQLQCVLEAFDEVGIQNDKSYSVINSGAILTVNDIRLNPYDNYHLNISEVTSLDDYMENKTLGDVVIDTDISSENGYALDLDPGRYCIRVKDNYENGSSNEFTKIITVIEPSVRNEFFPVSDSVTIFTDFGSLISAMTDYIGMTFEEITELYGTDYELYQSESGEENQLVITYTDESVPFSFVFQCSAESFAAEVPDADDTVKTVDFHQESTTAMSVDDVVFPHTKYAQLKSTRDGLLWKDISLYSYTYKVGEISVDFKYYAVPTDDSIADFITVTLRDWSPSEADAKAVENEILYQPVLDYYGEKCTKEHKENEITYCYCGAYFGDIDGNGTEELLIEEGFSEQGRMQHIYTIQNGKAVELGSYNAWHLALYDDEIGDGKLVAVVTDPSGPWIIYNITIESNSINQTEINKSNDYPSYSNPIEFLPIYTFLSDYTG